MQTPNLVTKPCGSRVEHHQLLMKSFVLVNSCIMYDMV